MEGLVLAEKVLVAILAKELKQTLSNRIRDLGTEFKILSIDKMDVAELYIRLMRQALNALEKELDKENSKKNLE